MTAILVWLNAVANAVGRVVLAPLAILPGWLSATLVAVVTGVLLLLAFKYTSHQGAIRRARNSLKANLLALSLFKDNMRVCLRAQAAILGGAVRLVVLAIVPMLVMALPVSLLLGQLALVYQARPLRVGEEAVLAVYLRNDPPPGTDPALPAATLTEVPVKTASASGEPLPNQPRSESPESAAAGQGGARQATWPSLSLAAGPGFTATLGPVRVESQRLVCWNVRATEPGQYTLAIQVGDEVIHKELVVGDGLRRVSLERPAWNAGDILIHPGEAPFPPEATVQRITLDYPQRAGWPAGSGAWLWYWFGVSFLAALAFRRTFNVNL